MSAYPAFDEPTLTVPAESTVAMPPPGLEPAPPLDSLVEPQGEPVVDDPVDEPLVDIDHDRITVLCNYHRAGWKHAVDQALMRVSAAERLAAVADALPADWGLAVFDAWRPMALQQDLFDAAYTTLDLAPGFMAPPSSDPRTPPPHLTGGSVDLTLTWRGVALGLGTGFDDPTPVAHAAHFEAAPGVVRELRRFLVAAMNRQDFIVYIGEWWHFEYGTRRWGAITGNRALFGATSPSN